MGLIGTSLNKLAAVATMEKDPALQKKLEDFVTHYRQFDQARIKPVERIVTSIDPVVSSQHAGDVLVLAQNEREKLWQLEGILRLGRYKYDAPLAGDHLAGNRLIRQFCQSSDPAIRCAAIAARDLSVEQFRQLGEE
jgi:hypothetical protein